MSNINYKHLHYFWVVAKAGSIARASEQLHLTPQTISGQLSLFESVQGEQLFKKNGRNLAMFIEDFKSDSPETKIRLMGHSLGSQVILSTVGHLAKKSQNNGIVESVYFFGASITSDVPSSKKYGKLKIMSLFFGYLTINRFKEIFLIKYQNIVILQTYWLAFMR